MNAISHQLTALALGALLPKLEGVDREIVHMRAQMHLAAAGGDYIGEAAKAGSYHNEKIGE